MNKYERWYNEIVESAREREARGCVLNFKEKHHIIPRCLGGDNRKANIVVLTPREHYLCHILLIKFTKGKDKYKIMCAIARFGVRGVFNSRVYEARRIEHILSIRGKPSPFKGIPKTEEERAKMRKPKQDTTNMGRHPRTEETKDKFRKSRIGKGCGERNSMSDPELRKKVAESKVGRKRFYGPDGTFKYCLPENAPAGWTQATSGK